MKTVKKVMGGTGGIIHTEAAGGVVGTVATEKMAKMVVTDSLVQVAEMANQDPKDTLGRRENLDLQDLRDKTDLRDQKDHKDPLAMVDLVAETHTSDGVKKCVLKSMGPVWCMLAGLLAVTTLTMEEEQTTSVSAKHQSGCATRLETTTVVCSTEPSMKQYVDSPTTQCMTKTYHVPYAIFHEVPS